MVIAHLRSSTTTSPKKVVLCNSWIIQKADQVQLKHRQDSS